MQSEYLRKISDYAKEENFPFEAINISFKLFPNSFYDAIISYLKNSFSGYVDDPKLEKFNIIFTEDKNAYFEIIGNNNRTRVIIVDGNLHYDNLPPAYFVKEEQLIDQLQRLEFNAYRDTIEKLPIEFINKYVKEFDKNNIFNSMSNATKIIIDYCKWCNNYYKESIDTVFYNESESKNTIQSSHILRNNTIERKNDEIPFKEREKVLSSFNSVDELNAKSSNTNSMYKVKIFKIKKTNYRIVLEPIDGTKYTKVVYIDKEKLNHQEIVEIVINSLQLNRKEISNASNISRHSHTDLEAYKNLIKYVATGENNGISTNTKSTIDKIEAHKKH